jgi:hypothetical protein
MVTLRIKLYSVRSVLMLAAADESAMKSTSYFHASSSPSEIPSSTAWRGGSSPESQLGVGGEFASLGSGFV